MNKKIFFAVISVFIFIVLVLIILIAYLLTQPHNNNNAVKESNPIVSSPVSYATTTLTPSVEKINSINISIPASVFNLNKKFIIDSNIVSNSFETKVLDNNHTVITSQKFSILLFNAGEGNPKNGKIIADNQEIGNNLGKKIFRINNTKNNDMDGLFVNYNLNYKSNYFYSDTYNIGCLGQFSSDEYCGTDYINFEGANNSKYGLRIVCLTNSVSDVSYCDNFVKNLSVKINE